MNVLSPKLCSSARTTRAECQRYRVHSQLALVLLQEAERLHRQPRAARGAGRGPLLLLCCRACAEHTVPLVLLQTRALTAAAILTVRGGSDGTHTLDPTQLYTHRPGAQGPRSASSTYHTQVRCAAENGHDICNCRAANPATVSRPLPILRTSYSPGPLSHRNAAPRGDAGVRLPSALWPSPGRTSKAVHAGCSEAERIGAHTTGYSASARPPCSPARVFACPHSLSRLSTRPPCPGRRSLRVCSRARPSLCTGLTNV